MQLQSPQINLSNVQHHHKQNIFPRRNMMKIYVCLSEYWLRLIWHTTSLMCCDEQKTGRHTGIEKWLIRRLTQLLDWFCASNEPALLQATPYLDTHNPTYLCCSSCMSLHNQNSLTRDFKRIWTNFACIITWTFLAYYKTVIIFCGYSIYRKVTYTSF